MTIVEGVTAGGVVLTEGSLIERLHRDPTVALDPHVAHAGLVYEPGGRAALEALYRQHLDIAAAFDCPFIVCTPTWRANPERLRAAGFAEHTDVNGDGFRFVAAVRKTYGDDARHVWIGGLMGCRGDAYQPVEALPEGDAAEFHAPQARALAAAGVDFLMAATLPAAGEAVGLARAFAGCGVPYLLSFVLRPVGTLLDGTPLHELVARIDRDVRPSPLAYAANCVHPTVFAAAMEAAMRAAPGVRDRVLGMQANTSARRPEELDGLPQLEEESPATMADLMWDVHRRFGTRILGGCCGTDGRHIRALAERLKPKRPTS